MRQCMPQPQTRPGSGILLATLLGALLAGPVCAATQPLAEIAQAAEAHATRAAKQLRYKGVKASAHALDARLSLVACSHPLQTFSAPGSGAGRTTIGVRCTAPKPWTLYVPVSVTASVETITLRQALPRGTLLQDSDLQVKLAPAHSVRGEYIGSLAAARGKQLRRSLRADQPLYLNMLMDPNAIERGQTTLLLSSINSIEVKMNGTALASGAVGETIRVRNDTSGKTLQGVVTEDGSVRIP